MSWYNFKDANLVHPWANPNVNSLTAQTFACTDADISSLVSTSAKLTDAIMTTAEITTATIGSLSSTSISASSGTIGSLYSSTINSSSSALTINGSVSLSQVSSSQLLSTNTSKQIISGGILIYPIRASFWADELYTTYNLTTELEPSQEYSTYTYQTTPALHDIATFSVFLQNGTYYLQMLSSLNPNCGIATIYIDGVNVAGFDMYSALQVFNYSNRFLVNIVGSGCHTITIKMDSKNASSSGYAFLFTKFWFFPQSGDSTNVNP